jgi:nucleotide-binding universal stress UspA family protein
MTKLLVPVDGSQSCMRAIDHVIARMQRSQQAPELHILTVHPPIPYANAIAAIGNEAANRFYREEGNATLKSARDRLDAAAVPYKHHISVGDPADVISRFIKENQITEVIMGTRGMGAVSNLLLGSVASKVIHLVEIPVTLIK